MRKGLPFNDAYLAGLEEILPELIQLFKTQSPLKIKQMQIAVSAQNAKILLSEAHSLKSSSAHLGCLEMSNLCVQLEKCASEGDFVGAAKLVNSLETAYEQACLNFDISKPPTLC